MRGMRGSSTLALAVIAAIGVLVGTSGFTFWYARGFSYLSDDPTACVNCHIMRDNFASWRASTHRMVSCNECHVPHDLLGKYIAKADHGFRHSYAFTFEDVQVIRIKEKSLHDVQQNCVRCHQPMVSFILGDGELPERACTRCHTAAGHAH